MRISGIGNCLSLIKLLLLVFDCYDCIFRSHKLCKFDLNIKARNICQFVFCSVFFHVKCSGEPIKALGFFLPTIKKLLYEKNVNNKLESMREKAIFCFIELLQPFHKITCRLL